MNRRSVVVRYLPLVAIVAIQALIVLIAPSKAPGEVTAIGPGAGVAAGGPQSSLSPTGESTGGVPGVNSGTGGAGGGGGPASSGGGGAGTVTGRTNTQDRTAGLVGDTSHCKKGRQFDLIYSAPPCQPKFTGKNPGVTYQGVTATEVKVVRFDAQSDAAVDAILATQDLSASDEEQQAFMKASEKVINDKYESWGRKIVFKTYKGSCDTLPPRPECDRPEKRTLVQKEKPFIAIWNTPISSASFDELSALKTVNIGGWHYSDSFSTARRPYHWDVPISGTLIAKHLAEYWCKRMAGRPPTEAGVQLDGKFDPNGPRRLGVITPDDPANTAVLNEFKALVKNCGGGVKAVYQYQQDIDRADEQRNAGTERMIENNISTIVCICDGIAPYFLVLTCTQKQYNPEHIIPGTGGMDSDAVGRLYRTSGQWEHSFGVSSLPQPVSFTANDAAKVWRAAGRSGSPYRLAFGDWAYYNLVGWMIQQAGPNLTPLTVEQGLFAAGPSGGWEATGHNPKEVLFQMSRGHYAWTSDVAEVYWDSNATSKFDGKGGAYAFMNGGKRYQLGQWPSTPVSRP